MTTSSPRCKAAACSWKMLASGTVIGFGQQDDRNVVPAWFANAR